ncbi:NAD(P)-dependent oxidoreductase [Phytoactinopolyspora limicola]|uniref:NAD(P)-dependent oxidoreductase n=1 Tax=Phytoactinopolyspora limicola TaxID=2715536 RepID=UPI0014076B79|nr:NAD(P)-binding domain-containing protein [Phytoactinopolyspora limicola]
MAPEQHTSPATKTATGVNTIASGSAATNTDLPAITVLGLGAMGQALARTFLQGGHPTTVWNRTPGRATSLVAAGAIHAQQPQEAMASADLVIVCLLDHSSVHDVLDPIAAGLTGRVLVNLTSTTPTESRELAAWATPHGAGYLDGGIMAVPDMIGQPDASILYSGDRTVFDTHRQTLELLGTADYVGADPGVAALQDFALLAGMYLMFAGFFQGAAMVRDAGISAEDFSTRAVPWLTAMAQQLPAFAGPIDRGDYHAAGQDLNFTKSAVDAIHRAGQDAGVSPVLLNAVKALVDQQVAAGFGTAATERIIEGLRESGAARSVA